MAGPFGDNAGTGSGALSLYAGWWPAAGDNPGQNMVQPAGNGATGTERVETERAMLISNESRIGAFLMNWVPFTAWIMSRFIGPRPPTAAWQSPFDIGGGERITRQGPFPVNERPFPYPYEIGAVSGLMPMLDQYSLAWAWGKNPSGPGVLTPIPLAWQASYPSLRKVTG